MIRSQNKIPALYNSRSLVRVGLIAARNFRRCEYGVAREQNPGLQSFQLEKTSRSFSVHCLHRAQRGYAIQAPGPKRGQTRQNQRQRVCVRPQAITSILMSLPPRGQAFSQVLERYACPCRLAASGLAGKLDKSPEVAETGGLKRRCSPEGSAPRSGRAEATVFRCGDRFFEVAQ